MGNLYCKSLTIEERREKALLINSNINELIEIAKNENLNNKLKNSMIGQNENLIPPSMLNEEIPIFNSQISQRIYDLYKPFYSFDKSNVNLIHTGTLEEVLRAHVKEYNKLFPENQIENSVSYPYKTCKILFDTLYEYKIHILKNP